jgi:hypothetical protein
MYDRFQRDRAVIWVAQDIGDHGPVAQAAFASPTDALNYAEVQIRQLGGWPCHFTIAGKTVRADAFLTRDHAFKWLCDMSVYGRVVPDAQWRGVTPETLVRLVEDGDEERGYPDEVSVLTLGRFFDLNQMQADEQAPIVACLNSSQEWVAGGGAAPIWWLHVAPEGAVADVEGAA